MFAVSAPAVGAQGVQSSSIHGDGVAVSAPCSVSAAAQCVQSVDVGVMVFALFLACCLWMRRVFRVLVLLMVFAVSFSLFQLCWVLYGGCSSWRMVEVD